MHPTGMHACMYVHVIQSKFHYHLQMKFAKVMFLHVFVCTQGVSRPWPRGEVEGSGGQVFKAQTQGGGWGSGQGRGCLGPDPGGCWGVWLGGVSRPRPGAEPPPSRQLLLWMVCILLECILVTNVFEWPKLFCVIL